MADEYTPQPGQCCGACSKLGEGREYPMRCGPTGLCVDREDGTSCRIFAHCEPEPKPVEPVTVTFERDDDPRYVVVSPGAFHWYRPELHAALLRIAAGPVTVQIPPAPCGECAGLRNEATKAKCDLTVAETARDLARAEAAKLREVIRFANDREGERTSAMSQVVKERDAARAESEKLRDERDTAKRTLDKLRNDFVRASDALIARAVQAEAEADTLKAQLANLQVDDTPPRSGSDAF